MANNYEKLNNNQPATEHSRAGNTRRRIIMRLLGIATATAAAFVPIAPVFAEGISNNSNNAGETLPGELWSNQEVSNNIQFGPNGPDQAEKDTTPDSVPLYKPLKTWTEFGSVPGPRSSDLSTTADSENRRGFAQGPDNQFRKVFATISGLHNLYMNFSQHDVTQAGDLSNETVASQNYDIDLSQSPDLIGMNLNEVLDTWAFTLPVTLCANGEKGPKCDGVNTGAVLHLVFGYGSELVHKLVFIEADEILGSMDITPGMEIRSVQGLNSNDGSVVIYAKDNGKNRIFVYSRYLDPSTKELILPKEYSGELDVEIMTDDSKAVLVVRDTTTGWMIYLQSQPPVSDPANFVTIRELQVQLYRIPELQYAGRGEIFTVLETGGKYFTLANAILDRRTGSMTRTNSVEILPPQYVDRMDDVKLIGSVQGPGNQIFTYVTATIGGKTKLVLCLHNPARTPEKGVSKVLGDYTGQTMSDLHPTVLIPNKFDHFATTANQAGLLQPDRALRTFTPMQSNLSGNNPFNADIQAGNNQAARQFGLNQLGR